MYFPTSIVALLAVSSVSSALPFPQLWKRDKTDFSRAAVIADFPDPAFVQDDKGTFWAFATNRHSLNVPVAQSVDDFNTFKMVQGLDALPKPGVWTYTEKPRVWAPDVVRLQNGNYVMYYSASPKQSPNQHCIGAATSDAPQGPYEALPNYFVCPIQEGGAIDPAGFHDPATGKQYVLYKVDGNSIGSGGACGNSNPGPNQKSTPIMMQEVSPLDGITQIGSPVEILDRSDEDGDGPYVEAPSLVALKNEQATGGFMYVLTFSSNCYEGPKYDVKYAYSLNGPLNGASGDQDSEKAHYTRGSKALLKTGEKGLRAPGGLDAGPRGVNVVYHANVNNSINPRQMRKGQWLVQGTELSIV